MLYEKSSFKSLSYARSILQSRDLVFYPFEFFLKLKKIYWWLYQLVTYTIQQFYIKYVKKLNLFVQLSWGKVHVRRQYDCWFCTTIRKKDVGMMHGILRRKYGSYSDRMLQTALCNQVYI